MQTSKDNSLKSSTTTAKSKANKIATMKSSQLMELIQDQLTDIYWTENALIKAMPGMVKNANSKDLITALKIHLEETKEQARRLEEVFSIIEVDEVEAQGKKCDAMDGLLQKASDINKSSENDVLYDAEIIAASQKIEHYEIATCGALCQFTKALGLNEVFRLLETTLQEEKEAYLKLSEVAISAFNIEADEA